MSGYGTRVHTAAGSRLFISTNLACPTEHTIDAFENLTGDYTEVGEITDMGVQGGREYNLVSYSRLAQREDINLKDTFSQSQTSVTMGKDFTDAGQQLVDRGLKEVDDPIAFKIILQNGDILYAARRVTSAPLTVGASGSIVSFTINLAQERDGISLLATGIRTLTVSTAGVGYQTDGVFTATQDSTSGNGTGAEFEVTIASGAVTTATLKKTGSGYAATNTVTIAINGNTATTDAIITVSTIVPALGIGNVN